MKKWLLYGFCLCLGGILSSCNNAPSPTQFFYDQKVVWGKCDPSLTDSINPEVIKPIANRLECATVKTPLDWKQPDLDRVALGIARVKAKDTKKRKGAIAMNPGGPGGDGLTLPIYFGVLFDNPEKFGLGASAESLKKINTEYDLIGFSPRGVGGSFKNFCSTNTTTPIPGFYTDRSAENIDATLEVSRVVAEACQRSPVTRYIDTEQTARDMDLIRALLGDEKLNYLGYSYGSWLGAWYAKLFPNRVGHFVLDSNTDFSSPFSRTFELQPASFQRAFDGVVVPYLARNAAFFELGDTEAAVKSVYADLPEEIKAGVTFPIVSDLYVSRIVQDIGFILLAARGLNAVYQENKALAASNDFNEFQAFLELVATHTYHSNAEISGLAAFYAGFFAQELNFYLNRSTDRYNFDLSPSYSVFVSILCNDGEWNKDKNYWIEKGNQENLSNPLIGGNLTDQPCIYWNKSTAQMPSVPGNMPALLMVQSEFDTATNTDGALTAFESLSNAKMVFVKNEYTHGIFPYGTACVDSPVAAFLLDGTLPEARKTDCEGLALPGEEGAALQSLLVKKEKTVLDTIHDIIRRNAIKPLGIRE